MKVGTYDPAAISIIVAGKTVTGFADGTFINVTRESDTWDDSSGADSEVVRVRTRDGRGTYEISLQPTSDSNDDLSTLLSVDEATSKGSFPVIMKDTIGRTVCSSTVAWVRKFPPVTFSKGVEVRVWVIRGAYVAMKVGGSDAI